MVKRTALIAVCLAGLILSSRAQETVYVATGSKGAAGVLYSVDPLTATYTQIAPILVGTNPIGLTGLAFNPLDGLLYGVTGLESPNFKRFLVTINPSTGAATVIGAIVNPAFGSSEPLTDLSFRSDGTLFGLGGSELFTVNLSNAAMTSMGSTGVNSPGGGLAFSPGGTLYTAGIAFGTLDTLDPATGARTVGPTLTNAPFAALSPAGVMNALAFSSGGVLYGSNSDRAQNGATITSVDLVTINTVTGLVTNIGALPGNIDAIAFSPAAVPEAGSTLAILGIALVGIEGVRRKLAATLTGKAWTLCSSLTRE